MGSDFRRRSLAARPALLILLAHEVFLKDSEHWDTSLFVPCCKYLYLYPAASARLGVLVPHGQPGMLSRSGKRTCSATPDLGSGLRGPGGEAGASRAVRRCLFGYMGHGRPKLQAASAHEPTHLLPAPTLSWCGGGRLAKAGKREETGVGVESKGVA